MEHQEDYRGAAVQLDETEMQFFDLDSASSSGNLAAREFLQVRGAAQLSVSNDTELLNMTRDEVERMFPGTSFAFWEDERIFGATQVSGESYAMFKSKLAIFGAT